MLVGMTTRPADPTLGQIVDALGHDTVALLDDRRRDEPVVGPRLWDAVDASDLAPGDVVLGVNVTPTVDVLERAAAAGVSAIALKGDIAYLAAEADRLGIALIAVASEVTWDQLYRLVQRAAATMGPTQEGDLFAFANALAALIGGAVAIEDPHGSLLAYSNLDQEIDEPRRQTILGRGNPASWSQRLENEGYYRLLTASPGPMRVTDPDGAVHERVVTLVRAGAEVLGSIWVVSGSAPLDPEAESVLAAAASQAALHLLRLRSHHDSSRRERGEQLRALLERGDPGDLGIGRDSTVQVVGFHVPGDEGPDLSVNRTRVTDAITMACEAFRRRVVCTSIGETVYALFPDVSSSTSERLNALTEDICARTSRALGVEVVAAISEPRDAVASAPLCRAEVDRGLRVLRLRPAGRRIATAEETRIASALLTLGDLVRDRPEMRLPGIQKLIRQDAERGKSYLETLRAFLDASGSVSAAAASLGIHVNTMRYRVGRVEEVSGLDLDNPTHRLVAAVELLAMDS